MLEMPLLKIAPRSFIVNTWLPGLLDTLRGHVIVWERWGWGGVVLNKASL